MVPVPPVFVSVVASNSYVWHQHDAAAISDLFAPDAVEVFWWESEGGAVFGQQAIQKRYAVNLAAGMNNHAIKLVQAYPIGSEPCSDLPA